MKIRNEISWNTIDGETIILITSAEKAIHLDTSGTEIWGLLTKGMDVNDIILHLVEKYDNEFKKQIEVDCNDFIAIMKEHDILID